MKVLSMSGLERFYEQLKSIICDIESKLFSINRSVGLTTKNLLKSTIKNTVQHGIEIVVNDDKSILVNGTADEDVSFDIGAAKLVVGETYILTGCPAGGLNGGYSIYGVNTSNWSRNGNDYGNGSEFVSNSEDVVYKLEILSGRTVNNLVFYPMVRESSITDDTYDNYTDDLKTQIEVMNTTVNTSIGMTKKNLLKNTVGTSTQNGITFKLNSDGSVTCSGTATSATNYRYILNLKQNTSYILSGCPAGGSTSTYNLFAMDSDTWSNIQRDTGSGKTFNTGTHTTWHIIIRIASGQTVNGLTFYPMLRYGLITDDAYQPYTDDLQTQIDALKSAIINLGGTV